MSLIIFSKLQSNPSVIESRFLVSPQPGIKEHLSGAEVRPCVAAGKGDGLSVKCQRFPREAGLIKGGLVMGRWCGRNDALQCCHLMNEEPVAGHG